jgi:hypothetical protein
LVNPFFAKSQFLAFLAIERGQGQNAFRMGWCLAYYKPSDNLHGTMTTTTPTPASESTQLAPSYAIPLVLVVLSLPWIWLQIWVSLLLAILGLFLLFQAITLQLIFTQTALDIYRGPTLIRRFPYQEWQNWRIFWPKLPVLFYFREVNSIHFLPILFDPKSLQACLEQHCPYR